MADPQRLTVRVLGDFVVSRDGVVVPPRAFGGRLSRLLVRVLVTRRGSPVSRDLLCDVLWPHTPPSDPDANLNALVHRARRALGSPELLRTTPGGYLFDPDRAVTVDAERFCRSADRGAAELSAGRAGAALRHLEEALTWWGGDPLPEDADAEWARGYREDLLQRRDRAGELAAEAALRVGDPGRAVELAAAAVAGRPLSEPVARLLARARLAAGDRAGALDALDVLRGRLAEEMGVDPTAETAELRLRLLRSGRADGGRPGGAGAGAGEVPGLPFVGRAAELAAVLAVLRRPVGGVVLVAGPAGAGKSRLLAEGAARSGPAAVTARAFLPERGNPWALARTLSRRTGALRPDLPATLPPRLRRALADLDPDPSAPPDDAGPLEARTRRALLLEGLLRLLGAAAAGGAGIVVDDAQWVDASSAQLLAVAAHRLDGAAFVLAFRPEEVVPGSPAAALLDELRAVPGSREVRLGPLDRTALADLVDDPGLREVLAEQTDGSPFAVAEVLAALQEESLATPGTGDRWRARSPRAVDRAAELAREGQRRAVLVRVHRQDDGRRALLASLALLGREAPTALLATAADRSETEVLGDLDALAHADLVRLGPRGWAVVHDLVADTVADELTPAHRAPLHARLAAALERYPGGRGERARHLVGAGDPRAGAEELASDAAQELSRHADREAMQLAESALALGPPARLRAELLGVRAEARARTGDLGNARTDLRDALALSSSPSRRARLLARLAMLSSGAEDLRHASELVELALLEAGNDRAARAQALAVAAVLDMNLRREGRSAERSAEALRLFTELGDTHGVADVLDARAMAAFLAGGVRAAVARFDEVARLYTDLGDLLRVVTPRSTRAHALLFAGRPADGLAESDRAVELARELGSPEAETYARWHRSEVLTGSGRAGEGLAEARAALQIAERLGHRGWTATALRACGLAEQAAGRTTAAEEYFCRSLGAATEFPLFTCWAHARLGMVLTGRGRLDEAAEHVAAALTSGPELGLFEARWAQARLARARGLPQADTIVRATVELARTGGHELSVQDLTAPPEGA